jgi:hypothetical protein
MQIEPFGLRDGIFSEVTAKKKYAWLPKRVKNKYVLWREYYYVVHEYWEPTDFSVGGLNFHSEYEYFNEKDFTVFLLSRK